jgi:multiple sugar transport system permease protein
MTLSSKSSKPTPTGRNISPQKIFHLLAIFCIVVFCLAPILWQVLTSVKSNQDISAVPVRYLPSKFTIEHYINLFTRYPFLRYILNSAFISITSTAFSLAIGAPAAYALTRLHLWGERAILAGITIITLFPSILLLLGLLEIIQALRLSNNYLALIITYSAINLPLTILVMRSFFQQLPRDLEDAAKVDGYSTWQMLVQILLPLTLPALVTTGILTFIFAWNEFIFALTFITREDLKTIPVMAAQLGGASTFEIPYGPTAAATVIGTFPLVVLVLIFQRKIVQGLTAGAVKG